MAWTYSDYITQSTPKLELARLKLHIQEVSDSITADVSSDGKSRANHPLNAYLESLWKRHNALQASASGYAGNRTLAIFPRSR